MRRLSKGVTVEVIDSERNNESSKIEHLDASHMSIHSLQNAVNNSVPDLSHSKLSKSNLHGSRLLHAGASLINNSQSPRGDSEARNDPSAINRSASEQGHSNISQNYAKSFMSPQAERVRFNPNLKLSNALEILPSRQINLTTVKPSDDARSLSENRSQVFKLGKSPFNKNVEESLQYLRHDHSLNALKEP